MLSAQSHKQMFVQFDKKKHMNFDYIIVSIVSMYSLDHRIFYIQSITYYKILSDLICDFSVCAMQCTIYIIQWVPINMETQWQYLPRLPLPS